MSIKLLNPQIVARIAAGEVVERPSSVVKELVENALDAGASQIVVESQGGGVSLLRIADNGVGIPTAEVELTFQRYATSKISDLDDLESIITLGFRGEALASIAAVAEVELATRAAGEAVGSYLSLRDGVVVERNCQGRSQGTTLTVKNLFRSMPARLKFLKSPNTENSRIANVVTQYALAFAEVKFVLSLDGRTVLRTPGSGRLIDTVIEVYGPEIARNMRDVSSGNGGRLGKVDPTTIVVTGLLGMPAISRASRNYLSFFVNHRWVNSRLLAWVVEEAYHGLLMTGKHPVAVLNISLPSPEVDVNVHPTKTEIRFHDERRVFTAVQQVVRRALLESAPLPKIEEVAIAYVAPQPMWQMSHVPAGSIERPISLPPTSRPIPAFSFPALRLLGQLASSYILAEGPDGLYLIDQHAAHENILFTQIKEQRSRQQIEVQGLLEPVTFEVSPQQDEIFKSYYKELAGFGFSLEPFGERAYLVRTVPVWLHRKDWMGVLRKLTDVVERGDDWVERLAISIACHSAIRAGQVMSDDEMRELLRQLELVVMPSSCPHGRPTMIHLTLGQLEKEFGRRG